VRHSVWVGGGMREHTGDSSGEGARLRPEVGGWW
jgi:hypothetical protein